MEQRKRGRPGICALQPSGSACIGTIFVLEALSLQVSTTLSLRFNSLGAVDFWQPVLPRCLTHPGLFIYAIDFCLGCPTCCTQVCSGGTEYREIFPMKCFTVRDKDFKARTALREISCLGCPWFSIIPKCREF